MVLYKSTGIEVPRRRIADNGRSILSGTVKDRILDLCCIHVAAVTVVIEVVLHIEAYSVHSMLGIILSHSAMSI